MKRFLMSLVVVALTLAACGEVAEEGGQDPDGAWELSSGSLRGEPIPMVDGWPISLTIEGEMIGGTAACNGYGGRAEIDGASIAFSQIGITEMACGDLTEGGVMDSESMYMEAFLIADTFLREDGTLTLTGPEVELVYQALAPVPTAELTGTVWVLDGLVTGDAVSNTRGPKATLELFTDGSLIGSTGCRTLTGSYVISGASVEFTDFAADGECPPGLSDQDNHVISVLGDGFRVEIDGDRMTVTAAGQEGLSYKAES